MRCELNHYILTGKLTVNLLDFRRMAVRSNTVGLKAFVDAAVKTACLQAAARTCRTAFGINHNALSFNQLIF